MGEKILKHKAKAKKTDTFEQQTGFSGGDTALILPKRAPLQETATEKDGRALLPEHKQVTAQLLCAKGTLPINLSRAPVCSGERSSDTFTNS